MQRTIMILTIVASILAAPFLCDAGVTAHECHCDSVECCPDEGTSCEPDPCDDVYKETREKTTDNDSVDAVVSHDIVLHLAAAVLPNATARCDSGGNPPFPDSDLPLRI